MSQILAEKGVPHNGLLFIIANISKTKENIELRSCAVHIFAYDSRIPIFNVFSCFFFFNSFHKFV